jgi:hypothetical protein
MVERDGRPHGLRIVLPKRTYVLPWTQFLYAEGAADAVRLVFTMHDVIVIGSGLDALLADVAAHAVTGLRQPSRADTFERLTGPRVLTVDVRRIEQSEPT